MSSGHYSSSETCSDGSGAPASGSSTLPPTPPLPPSASSLPQLTSAELAELPPVPMSSSSSYPTPSPSSAASESQRGSVGVDRAGNQESSKGDSSSPYWEEAEEELDDDVEYHSGNGGSESDGTTARGASGEPVDAPLMVPDWLPDPPSSSLASVSASQRTGEEGVQQRAASTVPDSEHSSRQDENVPADTAVLHGCADGADSSTAAFRDADEPGVARDYREAVVSDAAVTENDNEEEWRQGGRDEADDVSDAAVAARAASITSDVVAESVWASEERASAALQQFSTSLHSKLVEGLIDDAVVAVERTLQDTVRQHESRVRALMAQNRLLDRQLAGQAVQMQSIRKDLEDSILRDLQRVLRVDLRQAFRSASADRSNGKEVSAESTTPPSPSLGRRPSSDAHSPSAEDDVADSIRMQRRSSEGSVPSTYAVDDSAQPSVEELLAAYVNQRGTLELLQKERAQWWESTAVLRDRLFAATREVVQLRQEVERLQTTTVDVAEHCAVVQARGEAEHQCALMRLQLTKHIEEAQMMEALVERRELAQPQPPDAAESNTGQAASTGAVTATATAAAAAAMNEELLRKGPQWDIALRELEEQATIAANSRQLREQLAKAEEELRSLQKDRDASVAYAAELKKEGDVLRADLQSMLYRNSVLSQQVASLLVKVEHTCRANRQLQAMQAASPPPQQQQGPLDQLGAQKAKRSLCAPTSSRSSSSTVPVPSNELLSTLPSQAERRSAWLSVMWPWSTSGGSDAAAENRLNTAVLYDRQKHRQPPPSPLASADASKMSSPTEVEEGVQQRLNTYAASRLVAPQLDSGASLQLPRRPRHVSLRQLGSATLEVDRVCSPHLPASDQLSGYALGRLSAFSTVDVARGTVTRQVGSEEVTVLLTGAAASSAHGSPSPAAPDDSRAGDVDVWTSAAAASPSTRRVHSTDDVSRDPNLLRLLDTLDKDESLDRFSVNSVAELVLRNQELVKQLYEATQRAEAAERRRQQQQGGVSASQLDEKGPSLGVMAASARDPSAPLGSGIDANFNAVPATLTSTTAELLLREGDPNSRKRARDGDDDDRSQERGDAEGGRHVSGGQDEKKASHQQVTDGAGADSAAAVVAVTESWFTKDASDAVASMIDAMVRRRDVRLTSADTEVSRALLQALAAQRATDKAVQQPRANGDGAPPTGLTAEMSPETDSFSVGVSSRALSSCLHSLAHLCLEQSSALVELARKAEHQNQEMQTAVQNTWTEVQQVLLAALQTSRAALASSTSASDDNAVASASRLSRQRVRREGGAVDSSCVVGNEGGAQRDGRHEFRPEEQVALLHQLRTLLRTAAKKDETLLRVYQAAQARRDARQNQEKERVARLLLKLERKRRIIKALQLRHANMNVVAAVGADPGARGLSHPSPLDCENSQGTVAAGVRLSPQPGSPARRTPPMPPMVLPAAGTTDADDERRGDDDCNRASSMDSGSSHPHRSYRDQHGRDDDDGDSDDELDDEILTLDIFRELQQQLALSQANHQAAQEELDAEKTKHAALLERMWVLEAARDDAVAVAERLERRVSEMLTREEYQAAVAELEVAAASLTELNTELSSAKAAHVESQEQVEDLKRQLEAQQREAKQQHRKMEDAMRRREQRLLSEEDRFRQLHEQLNDLKQYAAGLEKSIALARREVCDQQELVRHRDSTIDELKAQMLMRDDVQELLCRLYPNHSVLHANAQLVRGLSETTARLQLELAETRQDLAHAREELQQRELSAREAVQDRQAAEVHLQDALARLAVLQEPDDGGDAVQRSPGETAATRGTTHPQTADAASRMAALFNVDEASLTALRQRVRYLNACVEAQAKDIAVLRSAESSWKQREIDLRKQLEVMSADPVSLTARRYGLSACLSFEAQLDEMQARQDALESSRAQLQEEKDAIAVTVQEHAKAAAVAQGAADAAQAVVERTKAQLTSATEKCAALSSAIARLESERDEESSKRVDLERRYKQVLSELADTKRDLSAVQESLEATGTQRDYFWKDNNLLISKVEELEKALLQSDAEKRAAREALAQGLSASSASASRRRRGGDSGAADRYRGQASLTQDLSLSSLSARPS